MKTTIDFPDELLQRAKIAAIERRTTLRELVIEGVDQIIRKPHTEEDADARRKAKIHRLLSAMRASNTEPMVPMSREEIYAER